MPRGTRTLTLTLTLDTSGVERGLQALRDAGLRGGSAFSRMARVIVERQRQDLHGAGNRAGDGTWQSDMCAAWVHESCPPLPRCDCTCHGGTVR